MHYNEKQFFRTDVGPGLAQLVERLTRTDILRARVRIPATSLLQQYVGTGLEASRPPRGQHV